nr:hypothetical protein [Tanacetum cinerariifolium]
YDTGKRSKVRMEIIPTETELTLEQSQQETIKEGVDYEQVINVLAMEKSRLEEELRATKSKQKLYDRLFFIMLGSFSVDLVLMYNTMNVCNANFYVQANG